MMSRKHILGLSTLATLLLGTGVALYAVRRRRGLGRR